MLKTSYGSTDKHMGTSAEAGAAGVESPATEDAMDRRDIEEMGDVLTFPAQDIAEQLTLLDAVGVKFCILRLVFIFGLLFIHHLPFLSQELFVKVVPFHCLGCIWSQRDKKENRNLAPTVRATIAQFNAVTNCVITSLLCPSATFTPGSPSCPLSSPTHRAKIIEKWISVAQVCIRLKTYYS